MSASPNPNPKTTRSCLFYAIFGFIVLPMLLICGTLGVFVARDKSAAGKIAVIKQEYIADGLPVDNASLDSYYSKMASDEHAGEWVGLLDEVTDEKLEPLIRGVAILGVDGGEIPVSKEMDPVLQSSGTSLVEAAEDLEPEPNMDSGSEESFAGYESDVRWNQGRVRKFLMTTAELRERIHTAAQRQLQPGVKPVRFPVKLDGYNTLLSQVQNMRQLARFLAVEGEMAVYDRDSEGASRCIKSMIGASDALGGDPMLISQLVRIAINGIAMNLLKRSVEQDVLTDGQLVEIGAILAQRTQISATWYLAHHGERATALPVFEGTASYMETPRLPFRSNDALYFLENNKAAFEAELSDINTFRKDMKAAEQELNNLVSGNFIAKLDSLLTQMVAPAATQIGDSFVREATMHRLALLALGVRLYEKRNGSLPGSLEDLKNLKVEGLELDPAVLMPIGKKPFGFKVEEQDAKPKAVLWGFSLLNADETPDEPPKDDPGLEIEAIWVWQLDSGSSNAESP
ncbi:MAG: hypothetical protein AAF483_05380 [Planctomycetota bacterium]